MTKIVNAILRENLEADSNDFIYGQGSIQFSMQNLQCSIIKKNDLLY